MAVLADREQADAGLVEVDAVAVPDLVGAIPEPFVEEGVVGGVRRAANLFGVNRFRFLAEDIGKGEDIVPVPEPQGEGRFGPEVRPVARVADVLAFGVVGRLVGDLPAEQPVFAGFGDEAAAEGVGLPGLVAGRKLQDVNRIVPRIEEHRSEHVLALDLLEAEGAGPGGAVAVAGSLRFRAGLPEGTGGKARAEAAGLVAAVDFGGAAGGRIGRADLHDLLRSGREGQEDANGAG